MKPSIRQKLDLLVDRLDEIDRMLSAPSTANDMDQFRKLSRERAEIEPVILQFHAFRQAENDLAEADQKRQVPTSIEAAACAAPKIWINAGARGLLLGIAPADALRATDGTAAALVA